MHIAIDIGNVIAHVNFLPFFECLSRYKNISFQECYDFLEKSQASHDLGIFSFAARINESFDIKSPAIMKDILSSWNACVKLDDLMMKFIEKRLAKGNKIALVSNIGFEHAALMEEQIIKKFNSTRLIPFFSCHVGARKPTMLYFQTFLSMHPDFKGAHYLDDRPENLSMGEKFGLKPVNGFNLATMHPKTLAFQLEDLENNIDNEGNLTL